MPKPRRRALLVMRNLLTCTMCSMALVAVLSVPVQVFPSSRDVPIFSRSYKLPKVITELQFISRLFFLSFLFIQLQRFLFFIVCFYRDPFLSVNFIFFSLFSSYACGLLLLFGLLFILFRIRNHICARFLYFSTSFSWFVFFIRKWPDRLCS